jgi:hypothetical protein
MEGNDTLRAKQRFLVNGMVGPDILYLTRDPLEITLGVIELPDQTRIPGGRQRAGDFGITLQFGSQTDRETYIDWFEMCVDRGENGIDPTYKRDGTIVYYRLFSGDSGVYANGTNLPPVKASIFGMWPSRYTLPDYDMNSDEGDGSCILEMTINFDSATLIERDPRYSSITR